MFTLDPRMIEKYADVLIKFALHGGKGVKPGEIVYAVVPDWAKPMYGALQRSIVTAGAHPMMRLLATGFEKEFLMLADDSQAKFFPAAWSRGLAKNILKTVSLPW